jgi:hypothetical protein
MPLVGIIHTDQEEERKGNERKGKKRGKREGGGYPGWTVGENNLPQVIVASSLPTVTFCSIAAITNGCATELLRCCLNTGDKENLDPPRRILCWSEAIISHVSMRSFLSFALMTLPVHH